MMNSNAGRRFGNNRQGNGGGARNGPRRNRWNDNQRTSSSNRNSGVQMGLLGNRPIVSPWESGLTPGLQQQTSFQTTFSQPTSFMPVQSASRSSSSSFGGSNFSSMGSPNKMRRVERNMMGGTGMDDHRGRGLLPSPANAPLLGAAPGSFPATREHLFQQRLGGTMWNSSFQSNISKELSNSSYFPSKRVGSTSMRHPSFRANAVKDRLDRNGASNNKNRFRKKLVNRTRTDSKKSDSSSTDKAQDIKKEKAERTSECETDVKEDEDLSDKEIIDEKVDDKEILSPVKKEDVDDIDSPSKNDADTRKVEDTYPSEALYCSICELDKFSSKKGYIRHLQGLTHAKMAELYHAKNAATLELLNASAKLSDMRQRDKNLRKTGIRGQQMDKTTEQMLLQRWLRAHTCCGTKFKSQFEMEEHKLSLNHLKTIYENKQKKDAKALEEKEESTASVIVVEEEIEADRDSLMESFRVIKDACTEQHENPLTSANIAPFDPSTLFGVQYMTRYLKFRCSICKGPLHKDLENHCKSHRHYESIVEHISKTEEEENDKKRETDQPKLDEEIENVELNEKESVETEEEIMDGKLEVPEVTILDEEMKDVEELDSQDPNADYIMVDCSDESPKPPQQEDNEKDDCEEENILDEVGERIDFDVLELENEISAPQVEEEKPKPKAKLTPSRRGLRRRRT